jgi:putative phosphoesterase
LKRIGVVSDTHCPEFIDALPAEVFDALRGVDLILHAGDVTGAGTLDELRALASVHAVKGDHDRLDLPASLELDVEGRRVALVHGNRSRLVEEPITFAGTVTLGYFGSTPGLDRWLLRRFPTADVIVHGHTHAPRVRRIGGRLIFSPGAVYQVTPEAARRRLARRPGWFEWSWLQVARHRRRLPAATIGLLEIAGSSAAARVVRL